VSEPADRKTAEAFAESWNRIGAVYTRAQFQEWLAPLRPEDLRGAAVIELGFGNGSLLLHAAECAPARLAGIDLGDTIDQARRLVGRDAELHRGDLTTAKLGEFDVAYCIGVIHHLADPDAGFAALLRHTKRGGRFHGWVYAREGNALIRLLIEPLRRVASRLPWWMTKYLIATPLTVPFYLYAKSLRALHLDGPRSPVRFLPLFAYMRWIAGEPFGFFRHVAFDQLVTPRTLYIDRATVERWLANPEVEEGSSYVIHRNGNSWKFGGRRRG
jgi:SAM-dependent methyltransferase